MPDDQTAVATPPPAPDVTPAPAEGFTHAVATSQGIDPEALGAAARSVRAHPADAAKMIGSETAAEIAAAAEHPINTALTAAKGVIATATNPDAQEIARAHLRGVGMSEKAIGALEWLTSGVPLIGGNLVKSEEQASQGNLRGMAGTLTGTIAPLATGTEGAELAKEHIAETARTAAESFKEEATKAVNATAPEGSLEAGFAKLGGKKVKAAPEMKDAGDVATQADAQKFVNYWNSRGHSATYEPIYGPQGGIRGYHTALKLNPSSESANFSAVGGEKKLEAPSTADGATPNEKFFQDVGGKQAENINSLAAVNLDERAGRIRIRNLETSNESKGKGHASSLLTAIGNAADKHGVTLELTASPYGDEDTRLNSDQLKSFYQRHGFVNEPGFDPALGYMIRKPQLLEAPNETPTAATTEAGGNPQGSVRTSTGEAVPSGEQDTNPAKIIQQQLAAHEANGGSTFTSDGKDDGEDIAGKDLYSVGSYPGRTLPVDNLTPEVLAKFKADNADILSQQDHAVGTWKDPDTGKHVLDVSKLYADRDEAIAAGQAANQKSIFHLGTMDTIPTGGTGEGELPPTKEAFSGVHYSQKPVGDTLRGADRGSAAAGSEKARLQHENKVPGVYVYREGATPEPQIGTRVNKSTVVGDKAIADIGGAQQKMFQDAHASAVAKYKAAGDNDTVASQKAVNDAEAALRDKGYDGYEDKKSKSGSVFLFGDQPVAKTPNADIPESQPSATSPTVSTRVPSKTVKGVLQVDHSDQSRTSDMEAASAAPSYVAKMVNRIKDIPGVKTLGDAQASANAYIRHVADNVKYIYNKMTPEQIANDEQWYPVGAHNRVQEVAKQHGFTPQQIAGITAVESPMTDWDQNTSLAERTANIWKNQQDTKFTPEMQDAADRITDLPANRKFKPIYKSLRGKTLGELPTVEEQAHWLRLYDEGHNPRDYETWNPDGTSNGFAKNNNGENARVSWSFQNHIEKAIRILKDGSPESISKNLGSGHKVRNFYNNMIAPDDPRFLTIDTHAVAGGQMRPISAKDAGARDNFGGISNKAYGLKGVYPLHDAGYRLAAKELDIPIPSRLQSPVWTKIREVFSDTFKTDDNLKAVDAIWKEHSDGKITADEARDRIWDYATGRNGTAIGEVRNPNNPGELSPTGVRGEPAGGAVGSGDRGATPGAPSESAVGEDEGDTSFNFGANATAEPKAPKPSVSSVRVKPKAAGKKMGATELIAALSKSKLK